MIRYLIICKKYGIRPVMFGGKKNPTVREKRIRECKIDVINMCDQMRTALDEIEEQMRNAPENGDESYEREIEEFRNKVKIVNKKMEEQLVVD